MRQKQQKKEAEEKEAKRRRAAFLAISRVDKNTLPMKMLRQKPNRKRRQMRTKKNFL